MTISEVGAVLRSENLTNIARGHDGITFNLFYGSERLSDPVLIVSFRRGDGDEMRATEWKVEK